MAAVEPRESRLGGLVQRLSRWTRKVKLERKLAIALLVAAVTSGILTFAAMTEKIPGGVDPWAILLLIVLDLVLLLALAILLLPVLTGCASVKAYQKEHLADPIMFSEFEAREELRELKWLEAREGSTGGVGGAGGGCACK